MDSKTLDSILDGFTGLKVLVIGDVMLDAYYEGPTDRISPEAPVPVVSVDHREKRLGGAANVALNVRSLGAIPYICSVIGDDAEGREFRGIMDEGGSDTRGLIVSDTRRTTVKTRIISQGQQLMRVDEEDDHDLSPSEEKQLSERIHGLIEELRPDALIFEDYNKGVLTAELIRTTIRKAQENGVPSIVDPKLRNFFAYEGVTLFKPNLKELREGLGIELEVLDERSLKEASESLREQLDQEGTLITLSAKGIFWERKGQQGRILPAEVRSIADVSGAGDTVVSVAALCLATGVEPLLMASLANLAGGVVCEEVGVVPIDKEKLRSEALALEEPS